MGGVCRRATVARRPGVSPAGTGGRRLKTVEKTLTALTPKAIMPTVGLADPGRT